MAVCVRCRGEQDPALMIVDVDGDGVALACLDERTCTARCRCECHENTMHVCQRCAHNHPGQLDELLPNGDRRVITARFDHSAQIALNISASTKR